MGHWAGVGDGWGQCQVEGAGAETHCQVLGSLATISDESLHLVCSGFPLRPWHSFGKHYLEGLKNNGNHIPKL